MHGGRRGETTATRILAVSAPRVEGSDRGIDAHDGAEVDVRRALLERTPEAEPEHHAEQDRSDVAPHTGPRIEPSTPTR